jgi:hypothetical protein
MADKDFVDVKALLSQLTLGEKVELLAGQGSFRMTGLEHHGIPGLIVSQRLGNNGKKVYLTQTDFRWTPWDSRPTIIHTCKWPALFTRTPD